MPRGAAPQREGGNTRLWLATRLQRSHLVAWTGLHRRPLGDYKQEMETEEGRREWLLGGVGFCRSGMLFLLRFNFVSDHGDQEAAMKVSTQSAAAQGDLQPCSSIRPCCLWLSAPHLRNDAACKSAGRNGWDLYSGWGCVFGGLPSLRGPRGTGPAV